MIKSKHIGFLRVLLITMALSVVQLNADNTSRLSDIGDFNSTRDTVQSIKGPQNITAGKNVTLNVDYIATKERTLAVYLISTIGDKKKYFYKRFTVQAGDTNKQITFKVPANIPLGSTYKYGTYISPIGKYFKDNLGKAYQYRVTVEVLSSSDSIVHMQGPNKIQLGQSIPIQIDYRATEERTLAVYFKSTTGKKIRYFYKRFTVEATKYGSKQVLFSVPHNTPLGSTYKYGVYIAPIGKYFKDNLGKYYQHGVTVEGNKCITKEKLVSMINANDDVTNVNTSCITDMSGLFKGNVIFNQDIGGWDTSSVTDMSRMFENTWLFNQDIGGWDTLSVTDMSRMFSKSLKFSKNIGGWDTSSVTDMSYMFDSSRFNGDISGWDTSAVTDMSHMFYYFTPFNQDIGGWDTSSVTNMESMFEDTIFNQDISGWDTSSVTDMSWMFYRASSFSQDLSIWNVSNVKEHVAFMKYTGSGSIEPNWNTLPTEDKIHSISGPLTITKGKKVTVNVDYTTADKDVIFTLQKQDAPWTHYYEETIGYEYNTKQITFYIPNDIPAGEKLIYQIFMTPEGKGWEERVDVKWQKGVSLNN